MFNAAFVKNDDQAVNFIDWKNGQWHIYQYCCANM